MEEVERLLYRTAFADLECDPLEHTIVRWTRTQLRTQVADPAMKGYLIELRDKLPPPRNDDDLLESEYEAQ